MKFGTIFIVLALIAVASITAQEAQPQSSTCAAKYGYLHVLSKPDNCRVSINGNQYNQSFDAVNKFLKVDSLAVGQYSTTYKTENSELTKTIDIKPDTVTVVIADFSKGVVDIMYQSLESARYIDRKDLLSPEEFVPVEKMPDMVYNETPEYPKSEKDAGVTGVVWVKALVDEEGKVSEAKVAKSSGTPAFDESAIKAAYKNKFKPGMQDGKPASVWVTYKVTFALGD